MIPSEPREINIEETASAVDESVTTRDPIAQDEILQMPSNLRQAAQRVTVPVQNNQTNLSSNGLLAGLIGIGVFALIAGLVVARSGVPGAIAS